MSASAELRVVASGPLALLQDLGRRGHADIGVSPSGAADRSAYALLNRLLGNPADTAAIEVLLGGLQVEVLDRGAWLCVTGAPCPLRLNDRSIGSHGAFFAPAGSRVALGEPKSGLRSYLGVRGGIAVDPVMGSRSSDTLSGLGPRPLSEGDRLPVGPLLTEQMPGVDVVPQPAAPGELVRVGVLRGPRADCFTDPELLVAGSWRVTDRSDRVGVRLEREVGGHTEALASARRDELPSEGVWRGAIQVPPSGEPVIFGPDHPVTGGYPVIGVVVDADLDLLAQIRPGSRIAFRWASGPAAG